MSIRLLQNILTITQTTVTVPDAPIPFAGVFDTGAWALMNLIITSLAFLTFVLLATIMLFRFFRRNKTELLSEAVPWLVVAAIAAMLTIFLFGFSQDFNGMRLVFDRWSPWLLGIYVVQVASTVRAMQKSTVGRTVDGEVESTDRSPSDRHAAASTTGERTAGNMGDFAHEPTQARQRLKLRDGSTGHFEDDAEE